MSAVQTRLLGGLLCSICNYRCSPARRIGSGCTTPRRCLETLIDFGRLNAGEPRVSVVAVDLETGEEVVFDMLETRLTADHLMSSSALIPDFPPVRVGARWLVDGGMSSNCPVDVVLGAPTEQPMQCFVVDLPPRAAPLPRTLGDLAMRQTDLIFACQTDRALQRLTVLDRTRPADRPAVDVIRATYTADRAEAPLKSWDFSETALTSR